jgi:DNA polymerase V
MRVLERYALAAGLKIGAASYAFTKAGVMLDDLLHYEQRPLTLFDIYREGSPALMHALDEVNGRFGKKTMVLASEGIKRLWQLRADHRSPRYTTKLRDLPVMM